VRLGTLWGGGEGYFKGEDTVPETKMVEDIGRDFKSQRIPIKGLIYKSCMKDDFLLRYRRSWWITISLGR